MPSWRLKQGEEEWQEQAAPPSTFKGLMGRCGTLFGSMADVAMESKGKAAEDGAVVAHLGVVCV